MNDVVEIKKQGYTDAYYGKDNSDKFSGKNLEAYQEGQELLSSERGLDVMYELGS